jgi:uncharacterized protein YciI
MPAYCVRRFLAAALISWCAVIPNLGAQTPVPNYDKANKDEIHAYVMLIRLRGDLYSRWKATGQWPDDADANRVLQEHSKYWHEQLRQGRALLAGGMSGDYWDNVALIIFEASSQAEAESIVAADPAVKAYVFQAQVRPFDVHFLTNKFDVAQAKEPPPAKRPELGRRKPEAACCFTSSVPCAAHC